MQYKKSNQKRSIMVMVEANSDLCLCAQRGQLPYKYYKVFTSTVDTTNTNIGRAGLHPKVFK